MKMYVVFKYTWIFLLGVMQKVKQCVQSLFESSGLLLEAPAEGPSE